jgi:hypothetical protein
MAIADAMIDSNEMDSRLRRLQAVRGSITVPAGAKFMTPDTELRATMILKALEAGVNPRPKSASLNYMLALFIFGQSRSE